MSSSRAFLRPLVALLVVTTVVAGPMAGSAAARHNCDKLDAVVYDAVNVGDYGIDINGCGDSHVSEAISNLTSVDADQTRSDVYAAALEEKADNRNFITGFNNTLSRSDSVIWMNVETQTARGFKNGSDQAGLETATNSTIADGYSKRAETLIDNWNTTVTAVYRAENTTDQEQNVSDNFVSVPAYDAHSNYGLTLVGTTTSSIVLPNGDVQPVKALVVKSHESGSGGQRHDIHPGAPTTNLDPYVDKAGPNEDPLRPDIRYVTVQPASDSDSPVNIVDVRDFTSAWDRINSQTVDLQAESDVFVNNTYSAFESGKIDANEVISRNTAMFNLAASQYKGNNSLYRSTAVLGMLGLDVPQLNNTGTMKVSYRQATYNGLLLADSAPRGSWEKGTTYDTANIKGSVYLVTTAGQMKTLDGQFTLQDITNEDGASIERINHTKTVYQTTNTSGLLTRAEAMQLYRHEAENRERAYISDATDGEGSSEGSGDIDPELLLLLLGGFGGVGLLAYLAASKSPQGQFARRMMNK